MELRKIIKYKNFKKIFRNLFKFLIIEKKSFKFTTKMKSFSKIYL